MMITLTMHLSKAFSLLSIALLVMGLQSGCRGYSTSSPPIHPNPNMDTQEKGRPYRHSDFFDDGQYMRIPVAGTIPRGHLKDDDHYFLGKINNEPARSFPEQITLDEDFLKRGQTVYDRTCATCHGLIGDGKGLVGKRLMVPPTSLHGEYMYGLTPDYFFGVISDGVRTMRGYKHMLSPRDRWAVVGYIRSLQMSQDMNGEWIKRSASWWTTK